MKNILIHSPNTALWPTNWPSSSAMNRESLSSRHFPMVNATCASSQMSETAINAPLGAAHLDTASLQTFDLACGLVEAGAKRLTLIPPYFDILQWNAGESRRNRHRKNRARLYSASQKHHMATGIFLLDLHAEGIPHYFEGNTFDAISMPSPSSFQAQNPLAEPILCWAPPIRAEPNGLNLWPMTWVYKRLSFYKKRLSATETKVTAVNAHVKGKHVIIYDDMI